MVGTSIGAIPNHDNWLAARLRPYRYWWIGMGLFEATAMRREFDAWLETMR